MDLFAFLMLFVAMVGVAFIGPVAVALGIPLLFILLMDRE